MTVPPQEVAIRHAAWQPVLAGVVATVALLTTEWLVRLDPSRLYRGYLFQQWSSEEFMQEVRINDLLKEGPDALWFLHVQPPMLEALRFLLVVPEWFGGSNVSPQVIDERMYLLFALVYGALVGLVFAWVRTVTGSQRWATAGALVVALYPGTLAMATLLDGTLLSATLITAMLYLLYLAVRNASARWLNWWLLALLVTSWTRTIFQLQILLLVPVAVWLTYRSRIRSASKATAIMSVLLTIMLFALPLKQLVLFGTTATTTFAGNHQVEVVSYRPTEAEVNAVEVPQEYLTNAEEFVSGFNSPDNVRTNYVLSQVGNHYYLSHPFQVVKNLIWGLQMNTAQAFKFTHEYSSVGQEQANRFVAALPWTPPMVNGLSVVVYLGWLVMTLAALLVAFGWRGLLRRIWRYWPMLFMVGVVTLTFLLANRYDWSEADRLKFVIEPFLVVLGVCALQAAVAKRRKQTWTEPAD